MTTDRSSAYIFQGIMYFYRKDKIYCRYQTTLRDAVDPALLQQALDLVLARADYFRVRLVWEKKEAYLEPNDAPCLVRQGSEMPEMPEETNGYLFSFSCDGPRVCFDWYHFLADGRGVASFLAQVLGEYCRLCYGADFAAKTLICSPPYDPEALFARFPECRQKNDMSQEVPQIAEGPLQRTIVRLDRDSLIRRALDCGVKPFSCLTSLLTLAMRSYLEREEIAYSYSADTRGDIGAPDALYNCVASFQGRVEFGPETRLEDFVRQVDADVRENLIPERKLARMAQQMNWVYEVSRLKAALKIKQRVFQMGEYMGGVPADFWISYLGNPFGPGSEGLMDYIEDFEVWVPPDGASICVEAASLKGQIILCLQDKTQRTGLAEALRSAFEQEGVAVLEARDLVPALV